MTIKELLEKARKLYEDGQALGKPFEDERKDIPAETMTKIQGMWDEADTLKKQADELKKFDDRRAELKSFFTDPERKHPVGMDDPSLNPEAKGLEFKEVEKYIRARGRYESKELSRLSGPDGGFWIGTEYAKELLTALANLTWMRKVCRTIQTSAAKFSFPAANIAATWGWRADNETISKGSLTNPAGKAEFTPHSVAFLIGMPNELLEDGEFDIKAFLTAELLKRMDEEEETQFIQGNGVSKPLGLLNSGLTAVDIATATSANIVAADLQKLPFELKAQYRNNARWLMSRTYVQQAMALRADTGGGAGTGPFLWNMNLQAGQPPTLCGYPVMESEYMPAASVDNDPVALFGDLSQYAIVERANVQVKVLVEKYAELNQTGLLIVHRIDGGALDINAFRRLNRT